MSTTLDRLADAGYCTVDWRRWQQGMCGTYAYALIQTDPTLRFGALGESESDGGWRLSHHFAHDDRYAYDSAGRHPLPYHGINGHLDLCHLDQHIDDYAPLDEEGTDEAEVTDARTHAETHQILHGRYEAHPRS